MAINLNGTTSDVNWSFASNPAGQLVSETGSNNAYAFGDHLPFNLDYTVNGLNQYSAVGATAYAYDTNGNLTSDGAKTYTYDTENRMVSAVSTAGTVGLRYDPLGRLYEVTDTNGSKRRLYYDGADLVLEYSGTGTLLRRFVHGASAGDDALLWYEGSTVSNATRRHLHADRLGSIVAVTDYQGNLLAANAYDEFGVPDQNNLGRFQYTGQAWVPELGMFYYKARMYSPTLGRFMQTDPIGYGDGMNMYAYVGNDPVNGVDPSGLVCTDAAGKVVQGVNADECTELGHTWTIIVISNTFEGGGGGNIIGGYSFGGGGSRNNVIWVLRSPINDPLIQPQNAPCPAVNPGSTGTDTENWVAFSRPGWQTINAHRSARISLAEAQANFPRSQLHNGPGDAWRHFRWNFAMAQSMGSRPAAAFANAHEVSNPNPAAEQAMDMYNNAMGRAFGSNPAYANLSPNEAANLALRSGCLQTSD